jgi:hypothetical protein
LSRFAAADADAFFATLASAALAFFSRASEAVTKLATHRRHPRAAYRHLEHPGAFIVARAETAHVRSRGATDERDAVRGRFAFSSRTASARAFTRGGRSAETHFSRADRPRERCATCPRFRAMRFASARGRDPCARACARGRAVAQPDDDTPEKAPGAFEFLGRDSRLERSQKRTEDADSPSHVARLEKK